MSLAIMGTGSGRNGTGAARGPRTPSGRFAFSGPVLTPPASGPTPPCLFVSPASWGFPSPFHVDAVARCALYFRSLLLFLFPSIAATIVVSL